MTIILHQYYDDLWQATPLKRPNWKSNSINQHYDLINIAKLS